MKQTQFDIIIDKLDGFVRRYYINRLIKGVLFFVGIAIALILLIDITEYVFRFGTIGRKIIFFGSVAALFVIFVFYVINPILKYFKLGKRINYAMASEIIGKHFPNVQDKLLNTLQLHEMALSQQDSELLLASIDQKSTELTPVPFRVAIDFTVNKKYLKYVLTPVLIALIILFVAPAIITDSSSRIVQYSEEFIPPAPFDFIIKNQSLDVPENQDLELNVTVSGEMVPAIVYIVQNKQRLSMVRKGPREFTYRFKNLKESFDFKLLGDQFYSLTHHVAVVPNPTITKFTIDLNFPGYLGLKNQVLENQGELNLPEGTKISWNINTQSTEEVTMTFGDSTIYLASDNGEQYNYQLVATESLPYAIFVSNEYKIGNDSLNYKLNVVTDRYPAITLGMQKDSVSNRLVYFSGKIEDDYGFRSLRFNYRVLSDQNNKQWNSEKIAIPNNVNQARYFHVWELNNQSIEPGKKLEYYFIVTDNDGLHGGKSTKTQVQVLELPSYQDLKNAEKEQDNEIKDELESSIDEAKRLRKEFERLQKDFLQKKELTWQDKKQLENLLEQQQNLQQNIEEMRDKNLQNQQKQQEFNEQSEEILEKQEEINKLFDELLTDEMKKLYEEIQKLMEELNKDQLQEKIQDFEMNNEELEKELDRTLELFKQLELEKNVNEAVEELNKLAEEQKDLAEETKNKELSNEELKEKQEELSKDFEEIKKDLDDIQKKNSELEQPMPLDDNKEEQEKVDEEQKQSEENLDKKKNKKASENQENAAEQMKQMASKMESQMQQAQQEGLEEDMAALRKLLNNIIDLSIDQETLMNEVNKTGPKDPRFKELSQVQREQIDDSKHIGDSLYALSKRVIQLESFVNKEMASVNENMGDALVNMADRNGQNAVMHQKYSMTALNNLALLLDEALQQMQQQMASMMPGQGNCQKPGKGGQKPSASDIKKMQDAMSKQLDQLKKEMEKGSNPGGKGGKQNKGMSKEIAQMAAQQAAIRQQLEELSQQLNEDGKGKGNDLKRISELMEENEKDLANQNLTKQTMFRQQEIQSRLLKAEKAEREREWDDKRISNEVKNQKISNPEQFSKYNKLKQNEAEMLETLPPNLNPYYKKKVSEYFNKLETE
jgi:hypothetical protein